MRGSRGARRGRAMMGMALAVLLAGGTASLSAAAAEGGLGTCPLYGPVPSGASAFVPARPGQLTVEVNLPAPVWWNGDTLDSIHDGFEYCLAANIAHRLGLTRMQVVNVAWDAMVAGQTKAFDLALSEISINDERRAVADFSVPYFKSDVGVLVRKGQGPVDTATLRTLRIGVQSGSSAVDFAAKVLKPGTEVKVFPDSPPLFAALAAHQIDAVLTDTVIVLAQAAQSHGHTVVAGQYSTGESYGAFYPKGSPNNPIIDKVIGDLIRDGSIDKLRATYLAGAWGRDPAQVPYLTP